LKLVDPRRPAPPTPEALVHVPPPPREADDLSPDPAFLDSISTVTGGASLTPATFPAFLESRFVKNPPASRESGAAWQPAWNAAFIALTIAALLATEWFIRRRQGLA
jgi:hypothetical protein